MCSGVAAVESDGYEGGAWGGKGRTEEDGLAASHTAVTAPPCLACQAGRVGRRGGGTGIKFCSAERSARRRGVARVCPRLLTTLVKNNVGCTEGDPSSRGRCDGQAWRGRTTGETAAFIWGSRVDRHRREASNGRSAQSLATLLTFRSIAVQYNKNKESKFRIKTMGGA